ncbi:MAG: hypothetical protein ACREUQ_11670, partial [Burkholderiales bacterium]
MDDFDCAAHPCCVRRLSLHLFGALQKVGQQDVQQRIRVLRQTAYPARSIQIQAAQKWIQISSLRLPVCNTLV